MAFKTTFLPASVKVNWGATKVECKSMSYIEYTYYIYIYISCIIYIYIARGHVVASCASMLHLNKHQMIPRENSKPPIPSADSSACRPAAPPCVVLSIHSWKAWLPQLERISYGNCESQHKILGTFFGFTYVCIYIYIHSIHTPKKNVCVCVLLLIV